MNSEIRFQVLYVEDNSVDANLTIQYFSESSPEITLQVVSTGKDFLQRLKESEFDIFLIDESLPDMTGLEILKHLITQKNLTPAVIVTGMGDEELVVKALRLGAVDYVRKDSEYLKLLPALLARVVQDYRLALPHRKEIASIRRSVLYVEREHMNVDLLLKHFAEESPNFTIDVSTSTKDAYEKLKSGRHYDIVLADLRMPDTSALDLLGAARTESFNVPFVIVTGKGDEDAAVAALKRGAYDCIVKRDNYLTQMPYSLENSINRYQIDVANARLKAELEEVNQMLEEKIQRRTIDLANEITERRHAEMEVRRLNEELEDRVKERTADLESFSYSVSHDLRSPLRAITGFSRILIEEHAQNLDEEGKRLLNVICKNTDRMEQLIDDLLAFSRLSRSETEIRPVDLNVLLASIIEELRIQNPAVEFVVGNLPVVSGDMSMLRQAFTNIISNSVKFSGKNAKPHVEIESIPAGDSVTISIKDNGVGFNQKYAINYLVFFSDFTLQMSSREPVLASRSSNELLSDTVGR